MKNLFPTAEILGKAATRETLLISKARKAGTATEMAFVNILPVRLREEQMEERRRERASFCFVLDSDQGGDCFLKFETISRRVSMANG